MHTFIQNIIPASSKWLDMNQVSIQTVYASKVAYMTDKKCHHIMGKHAVY
jgi:hypothetical protein